jgi:hypothetical protein
VSCSMAGTKRRCFVVVARWLVSANELFAAISSALGVELGSVRQLDDSDADGASVLVESYDVGQRGFLLRLNLYVDPGKIIEPSSDVGLARLLSRELSQDVIAPFPLVGDEVTDANSYLWILVRPDGRAYKVAQVPGDDDDGIVIDESAERLEPWTG